MFTLMPNYVDIIPYITIELLASMIKRNMQGTYMGIYSVDAVNYLAFSGILFSLVLKCDIK